jgi:hypothetical protein
MDPEALYVQLGRLVEAMPDLNVAQFPAETSNGLAVQVRSLWKSGMLSTLTCLRLP